MSLNSVTLFSAKADTGESSVFAVASNNMNQKAAVQLTISSATVQHKWSADAVTYDVLGTHTASANLEFTTPGYHLLNVSANSGTVTAVLVVR